MNQRPSWSTLTRAELGHELGGREGMPVQAMARAIAADPLVRLLRMSVRMTHILDDNELAPDATGLGEERGALVRR